MALEETKAGTIWDILAATPETRGGIIKAQTAPTQDTSEAAEDRHTPTTIGVHA